MFQVSLLLFNCLESILIYHDTFSTQSRMLITMTSVKILLQLFIPGSVITFWGRSNTCMYLTLDELADCFIIEILDFLPRDPFLYIFLLKCNLTNIFKEAPEENSTHRSCNFLPRKAHKGLEIVHGRNKLLSDLSRSSRKISILLNSFDNLFFLFLFVLNKALEPNLLAPFWVWVQWRFAAAFRWQSWWQIVQTDCSVSEKEKVFSIQ